MWVYYLVFFISFLIQFFPVKSNRDYFIRSLATFFPLFIYMSLRVNFGVDYPEYESIFELVHKYSDSFNERLEVGYVVLNSLLPSWRIFLVVTTAFNCIVYSLFFYRYIQPKYSYLAVLFFFLAGDYTVFFMFVGLRNAITIMILLLCIPLIEKRNFLAYFSLMIFASFFHQTAFIYFPIAYLLGRSVQMNKMEYYIWISVFFFFNIFSTSVLIDYVSILFNKYLERYVSYVDFAQSLGDSRGVLIKISVVLLFLPVVRYLYTHEIPAKYIVIFRLSLCFIFSYVLGPLNMRTSHYFIMFFIVAAIYFYEHMKQKLIGSLYILLVLLFFGYSFFVVFLGNPSFPFKEYHSILNF